MLTSISWVCWIFPKSVLAQQLGSGLHGLGIGAIGLDWATVSAYLDTPLASPWFATENVAVGFIFITYIVTPITYWFNFYMAKNFSIFSSKLFQSDGKQYNISSIVDKNFHIYMAAYEKNGPLYLTSFFAMTYGVGFTTLSIVIVHVLLFHGREIRDQSRSTFKEKKKDIHTRLMSNYKQVLEWWFVCILLATIAVTVFACEFYNEQLQLRWWGVLLACALAIFFTVPIGIFTATTNQSSRMQMLQGQFALESVRCAAQHGDPVSWRLSYGAQFPSLQRIAVKILSQTNTSSGSERIWSVFERIHTKLRNRLVSSRINDLVYVQYNLKLEQQRIQGKARRHI